MKRCVSLALGLTLVIAAYTVSAADLTLRFGTPFVTNSNLHKAMETFQLSRDAGAPGLFWWC